LKRDLIVISDEIFHKLVFDESNPYISIASIEVDGKSMLERTVTLRGISKESWSGRDPSKLCNWFTFETTFNLSDLAQHVTIAAGRAAGIFQVIDGSSLRDRRYRDKILNKDTIVCQILLEEKDGRIALFPASCGGFNAKDMTLRLTLSSSEGDIKLGMNRLSDFVLKLFQQN